MNIPEYNHICENCGSNMDIHTTEFNEYFECPKCKKQYDIYGDEL